MGQAVRRLMHRRFRQGEHECNGDPHPRVADRTDKDACAAAWGRDVEETIGRIDALLKLFGIVFDAGTGLWGSVMKDGRYIDDVPSDD
jgi:hypothetical protein